MKDYLESRMTGNCHARFGGQGNQYTDPYELCKSTPPLWGGGKRYKFNMDIKGKYYRSIIKSNYILIAYL